MGPKAKKLRCPLHVAARNWNNYQWGCSVCCFVFPIRVSLHTPLRKSFCQTMAVDFITLCFGESSLDRLAWELYRICVSWNLPFVEIEFNTIFAFSIGHLIRSAFHHTFRSSNLCFNELPVHQNSASSFCNCIKCFLEFLVH